MSNQRRLKRQLEKICKDPNNPIKNKYPFRYLNILDEYITAARTNEVLPYGVIGNDECPKNKDITFIQFVLVRIGDIKTKKLNP